MDADPSILHKYPSYYEQMVVTYNDSERSVFKSKSKSKSKSKNKKNKSKSRAKPRSVPPKQIPIALGEEISLVLYTKPTCPYCVRVYSFLESVGKTIPTKNIENREARDELVAVGGKQQVPCLVINGVALYESNDIIQWISEHSDLIF